MPNRPFSSVKSGKKEHHLTLNDALFFSHHRDARMAEVRKRNTKSETRDEVCIGYCHNNLIRFIPTSQKKVVTLHPNNYQFHSQLFEHL
jgi:hypothetical protein